MLLKIKKDFARNKYRYLMFIPVLIYLILFSYRPMWGLVVAFKQYRPTITIQEAEWVGFHYFRQFVSDPFFARVVSNTLVLNIFLVIFGFPVPIIFALLLNEIGGLKFKKFAQTASYLPHFISIVVVASMIKLFSLQNGLFNEIINFFTGRRIPILQRADLFRSVYVVSDIWQSFGWSSIIYIAAIASIDQELYESAKIDGAGYFRQAINITLPGILPTIIMLLILRLGSMLSLGYEKVLLLYNPTTYRTADIISTFIYRKGILETNYSYATAVGLFNSLINVAFLLIFNRLARKITEISLF